MALEKVRNILADADKHQSSVIAFDAMDYPTISSAIFGADSDALPGNGPLYASGGLRFYGQKPGGKSESPCRTSFGSLQQL